MGRKRKWEEGDEGTLIGFAHAVLLEKTRDTDSISKAVKTWISPTATPGS